MRREAYTGLKCTAALSGAVASALLVLGSSGCVRFGFDAHQDDATRRVHDAAGADGDADSTTRTGSEDGGSQDAAARPRDAAGADTAGADTAGADTAGADTAGAGSDTTVACNLLPTGIVASGDIVLWLDAAEVATLTVGVQGISEWRSRVGTLAFRQANGAEQPVVGAASLGGMPVVTFDGVDDWLGLPNVDVRTHGYSVVALVQWNPFSDPYGSVLLTGGRPTGHGTLLSARSTGESRFLHRAPYTHTPGGEDDLRGATIPVSSPTVLVAVRDGAKGEMRLSVNGEETVRSPLVDGDLPDLYDLALGRLRYDIHDRYSDRCFLGFVAEVLLFRIAVTATQEADLSAYLRAKWLGAPCP